jgi:hypothetical protein
MPEPSDGNTYLFYGDFNAAQLCYALALAVNSQARMSPCTPCIQASLQHCVDLARRNAVDVVFSVDEPLAALGRIVRCQNLVSGAEENVARGSQR